MTPTRNVGGRPLDGRARADLARLDLHDAAAELSRLDAELAQARILLRSAWRSVHTAAQNLETAEHLPRLEAAS